MTSIIPIQNLKCGGCINQIISSLQSIQNLDDIDVDLDKSMVVINYSDPAVLQIVKGKLKTMGYPSVGSMNSVIDKAKSFASCAVGRIKTPV